MQEDRKIHARKSQISTLESSSLQFPRSPHSSFSESSFGGERKMRDSRPIWYLAEGSCSGSILIANPIQSLGLPGLRERIAYSSRICYRSCQVLISDTTGHLPWRVQKPHSQRPRQEQVCPNPWGETLGLPQPRTHPSGRRTKLPSKQEKCASPASLDRLGVISPFRVETLESLFLRSGSGFGFLSSG